MKGPNKIFHSIFFKGDNTRLNDRVKSLIFIKTKGVDINL